MPKRWSPRRRRIRKMDGTRPGEGGFDQSSLRVGRATTPGNQTAIRCCRDATAEAIRFM